MTTRILLFILFDVETLPFLNSCRLSSVFNKYCINSCLLGSCEM